MVAWVTWSEEFDSGIFEDTKIPGGRLDSSVAI